MTFFRSLLNALGQLGAVSPGNSMVTVARYFYGCMSRARVDSRAR